VSDPGNAVSVTSLTAGWLLLLPAEYISGQVTNSSLAVAGPTCGGLKQTEFEARQSL